MNLLRELTEAQLPSHKQSSLEELGKQIPDMPKLQRPGDFVWHLHKFYDQDDTMYIKRRNPKYSKQMKALVHATYNELLSQDPKWDEYSEILQRKAGARLPYVSTVRIDIETKRAMEKLWRDKIKDQVKYLPHKEVPIGVESTYFPKDDIAAFIEDNHVEYLVVKHDKKGKVIRIVMWPNPEGTQYDYSLQEYIDASASELKEAFHYYHKKDYDHE